MKKKLLLIPLFCLCLIFTTSCGKNQAVSNDASSVTPPSQVEDVPDNKDTKESKDIPENNNSTGNKEANQTDLEELDEAVSTDVDNTISAMKAEDEKIKSKGIQSDVQTPTAENGSNDAASENTENGESNTNAELADGIRPEFKDAMDSYEAFYDEYCDILKKYTENPSDMKLLADYTDMLAKAAEMAEKFDAWENDDLNSTELKYYLDVNNRVTQKLLDVVE